MEKKRLTSQDFIEHRYLLLLYGRFGFPLSILILSVVAFLIGTAFIVPINIIMGGSIKTGLVVNLVICSTILPYHYYHVLRLLNELDTLHNDVYNKSIHDELTHAYNRRYFFDAVERQKFHTAQDLSILIIDIDDFKFLNDKYGHHVGDKALKLLTQHSTSTLRATDVFVRYGGDEFICLLPDTNTVQALEIASRIKEKIYAIDLNTDRKPIFFTLSIGVATSGSVQEVSDLISLADQALYKAKSLGKNQVSTL